MTFYQEQIFDCTNTVTLDSSENTYIVKYFSNNPQEDIAVLDYNNFTVTTYCFAPPNVVSKN